MSTRFRPGADTWIASDSSTSQYCAVLEDDEQTGYFYACEQDGSRPRILDACHIYDVRNVAEPDRFRESEAAILWSSDGLKAGLLINDRLHAVINFEARKAYCRANFPPPGGAWNAPARDPWYDELANLLD